LRSLGVNISTIAETSLARRDAAVRLVPGVRVYADHASMLSTERDIDALIVTTPPLHHATAVLAGLRAGLSVLCEKPLTLDPEAFADMQCESEARGLAVYSVNNWAYSPAWSRLLATATSGQLGAIRHAEIRVLRTRPSVSALPGDWRKDPAVAGGGILVDHGWHNLYLLRRALGAGTRLVCAVLTPDGAVDEVATVLVQAPGASGVMHLSWRASERSNSALLVGEKGVAELRDDVLEIRSGGTSETIRFAERLSGGSAHPEWLSAMWPAFEAERTGAGRGESLAEAAFCLEAIRAAYAGREAARA
jgi:predicted dehydrogenase